MHIGSKKLVCCPLQPHLGQDTQPTLVWLQFRGVNLNRHSRGSEDQSCEAPPRVPRGYALGRHSMRGTFYFPLPRGVKGPDTCLKLGRGWQPGGGTASRFIDF